MDIASINSVVSQAQHTTSGGNTSPSVQLSTPAGMVGRSAPVQTVNAVQQAAMAPSMEQIKQALQEINQSMNANGHGLKFAIDDESDRTIVKVIDQQTEEVIRQIPSEEALAIAQSLEKAIGNLIRKQA